MPDPKSVKVLAEKVGGASAKLMEHVKRQRAQEKAIRTALAEGPKTVAELATVLETGRAEALWLIMAFKKYGDVVEGELKQDTYTYTLKS